MSNPDDLNSSRTFKSDFGFKNRFIGNFLTRKLKELKFSSVGFSRIALIASEEPLKENEISESFLKITVPFNQVKYHSLSKEELADFLIGMYKEGITKASQTHEIPAEFLLTQLKEFKANNYLNEWEFKSKSFKDIGLKATLICKMTMDYFSLTLVLKKKAEILFSQEILNTLPDEIIYHWQFKEIVLERNEIKVLDEFKKPIYSLDLTFKA